MCQRCNQIVKNGERRRKKGANSHTKQFWNSFYIFIYDSKSKENGDPVLKEA